MRMLANLNLSSHYPQLEELTNTFRSRYLQEQ